MGSDHSMFILDMKYKYTQNINTRNKEKWNINDKTDWEAFNNTFREKASNWYDFIEDFINGVNLIEDFINGVIDISDLFEILVTWFHDSALKYIYKRKINEKKKDVRRSMAGNQREKQEGKNMEIFEKIW